MAGQRSVLSEGPVASRQGSAVPSLLHLMNSSTVTAPEKPRQGANASGLLLRQQRSVRVVAVFNPHVLKCLYFSKSLPSLSHTHMEKALYNFSVTVQH